MFVAKPIAEAVGFTFWKPLVWDKKKIGMGYLGGTNISLTFHRNWSNGACCQGYC